jgi:cytochrome bd ubiquinol oxidase subunit II
MIMVWTAVLALSILGYVLLDGLVLGVGIVMAFAPEQRRRQRMFSAVGPLWDGNEAWLIVAGAVLWGAFPIFFSSLMSAFKLPILLMLAGLVVRRIACVWRFKSETGRSICDAGFCWGSLIAAFMQGVMVGGLVDGLPLSGTSYVGGDFGWISLFAIVCGIGLCFGYSLLGASWLVYKSEGDVRDQARQSVEHVAGGLLAFFTFLFLYALVGDYRVMSRWLDNPYLLIIPAAGAVASFLLSATMRYHRHDLALYTGMMIFAVGFATLVISFWPYMVPFSITIDGGAAAPARLTSIFPYGAFVLPLMVLYTISHHAIFRGRGWRSRTTSSGENGEHTETECSLFALRIPALPRSARRAERWSDLRGQISSCNGKVADTDAGAVPDRVSRLPPSSDC